MIRTTVTVCKFVGTISLGLLTGQSITASTLLLPSLLSSPSPSSAQRPFTTLAALSKRQTALFCAISSAAFLLAYTLSPPRLRHPYLLYATIAIGAGWSGELKDYYFSAKEVKKDGAELQMSDADPSASISASTVVMGTPGESTSSDEEWEVETGEKKSAGSSTVLNGEAVRARMEGWKSRMSWKSGIWGLGWAISVLGLWGDGR